MCFEILGAQSFAGVTKSTSQTLVADAVISVILQKPAGRLGEVSPGERSENHRGVWGKGVLTLGLKNAALAGK